MSANRPLKILYLMVEDTAGTLGLFRSGHEKRGNIARAVTLFHSSEGFTEDVCLDLPWLPRDGWFRSTKEALYSPDKRYEEASGHPPTWRSNTFGAGFFRLRDKIWRPLLKRAFQEHGLLDFDIYHLEGGHGFLRMSAWPLDELRAAGKHVLVNYHGADMRTRGVFPWIDALAEVNTTSELDLLERHPSIEYVYLPFDVGAFSPKYELNSPLRLCHATRDRYWKGSDVIIDACEQLVASHGVEFELIENRPHAETLERKSQCDIYIDQVANLGGWGYGMNSVEALSMGLASCTNLVPQYEAFLGKHPFYNVHAETLYADLVALVEAPEKILTLKKQGRQWVEHTHGLNAVMDSVYGIYRREGWIDE